MGQDEARGADAEDVGATVTPAGPSDRPSDGPSDESATVTAGHRSDVPPVPAPFASVPFTTIGEPSPPVVAGYDLLRVIGRGGMGVVWEAVEHRFDRAVAVKVHTKERRDEGARDELWTEAFVAARIGDPGIVRVLDVGYTLDHHPYYAMELVQGTDLAGVLADGPLAPRKALDIAADIARAVAAAHEHGVIHRDLKPRNVIIDGTGRARVLDFGVAFDTHDGDDPYRGLLCGSPAYMAPEQAMGLAVSPQTDIFAIGSMLFEMLTGSRPFAGATTETVLRNITETEPVKPSSKNPGVHDDIDGVVLRCLAKAPEDRFPTARGLFETLQAILEGRPVDPATLGRATKATYAPRRAPAGAPDRPRREDAKKHLEWTWRLASSPSQLWPYVANTERFNRAVGSAPVLFSDDVTAEGDPLRTGEVRVLGMAMRWREYPFEWVKDREHSVFRWYRSGPLSALWNRVTLTPREGGGCELRHEIWLMPRGVIGQLAVMVETSKLSSAFDRFYRHLDEVLTQGAHVDPFEGSHAATPDQRATVDAGCRRLHAEGFRPALVEKLAMHLLAAPDGVIGTLRPYELADAWGAERGELLDLMMHASHEGLLEAAWDVVCPKCMLAHESLHDLAQVTRVGTCKACASSFERDLRDSVELVFTPHPAIRRLDRLTYCAGAPALRPHVLVQQILDPGEERAVELDLPRGVYRVASAGSHAASELVASAVGFETTAVATVSAERVESRPSILRAGPVRIVFRNDSEREVTLRVEVPGARGNGVSASTAMTHPSFKDLLTGQLLAHGEHLRVSHMAFLFVELPAREALFELVGDATACAELSRLDAIVHEEGRAHEGTAVPSSLALLVLAFPSPVRALRAALALCDRFEKAPLASPVAIAAHDGRCIALTRDGKAEFFGETLHRGQLLLGDCPAGGVAMSASFAADRPVAIAVHESGRVVTVTASKSGPYAGRRVTVLGPRTSGAAAFTP